MRNYYIQESINNNLYINQVEQKRKKMTRSNSYLENVDRCVCYEGRHCNCDEEPDVDLAGEMN